MTRPDNHVLAPDPGTTFAPLCPRCGYNLTGLPEARCPECGSAFEWDSVWRAARLAPRLAFERARGVRKVPGFFLTALTVLFTPWIFARQAVQRVRTGHALLFGAACFASIFLSLLWEADMAFVLAWLLTALIYIPLQTVLLTTLDVRTWQRAPDIAPWRLVLRSAHFWLLVGGYTSAVMMTELRYGPPLLALSDLVTLLHGKWPASPLTVLFDTGDLPTVLAWTQLALWLAGLACCHAARSRQRGGLPVTRWAAALVVMVAVLFLYATVVEHIGLPIGEWLWEWLN